MLRGHAVESVFEMGRWVVVHSKTPHPGRAARSQSTAWQLNAGQRALALRNFVCRAIARLGAVNVPSCAPSQDGLLLVEGIQSSKDDSQSAGAMYRLLRRLASTRCWDPARLRRRSSCLTVPQLKAYSSQTCETMANHAARLFCQPLRRSHFLQRIDTILQQAFSCRLSPRLQAFPGDCKRIDALDRCAHKCMHASES